MGNGTGMEMAAVQPHILVIEDDPGFVQLLKHVLKDYKLTITSNVDEARAYLTQEMPDVLLLDVMLPGSENGLDLLHELDPRLMIPVIIVTAFPSTERAISALRGGAFDFIEKPTSVDTLRDKVGDAVARSREQRANQSAAIELAQRYAALLRHHRKQYANSQLEVLRELSQGLLHEINNPLSIIKLNLELLVLTDPTPDDLRHKIEMIEKSAARIERVMQTVRVLNTSEETITTLTVREIITESLHHIQSAGLMGHYNIEMHLPDGLPSLQVRRNQVGRALRSILINAMEAEKSQPTDKRIIKIGALASASQLRIAVHNQHGSLPKPDTGKLFAPNFTTKLDDGSVVRGLGLGLFVARTLIEANSGTLALREEAAGGVTAIVSLPLAR